MFNVDQYSFLIGLAFGSGITLVFVLYVWFCVKYIRFK